MLPSPDKRDITRAARVQTMDRQKSTTDITTEEWYQSLNASGSRLGLTSVLRNNGSA